MGDFLNPCNGNSFTILAKRKDRYLFVDKTDFIPLRPTCFLLTIQKLMQNKGFLTI